MTAVHTLTDAARGVWLDEFAAGPGDVPGTPPGWSVRKRTLRGGPGDGVDFIEVDNGALRFSVLPTRGLGLWRGSYRGIELGWRSPVVGPVHPKYVELSARGGLGWLTGFDEWLCRCGLAWMGPPGDDNGFPLTLHGRIANLPAHRVELSIDPTPPGTIILTGDVEEGGLFYPHFRLTTTYTTVCGSNRLAVRDVVENRSAQLAKMQLLYHLNNGPPLLEAGGRLRLPVREVTPLTAWAAEGIDAWDTFAGPVAGFAEQVYACVPAADADGRTLAVLHDAVAGRGLALRWDVRALPCFTLWKNTAAVADGYVTGLEPATSFPRFRAKERAAGRVPTLPPGGRLEATWDIEVFDTAEEVASACAEVDGLQAGAPPLIRRQPM